MSLYKCEKCDCIENTALSNYWSGSRLCSSCDPEIGNVIIDTLYEVFEPRED